MIRKNSKQIKQSQTEQRKKQKIETDDVELNFVELQEKVTKKKKVKKVNGQAAQAVVPVTTEDLEEEIDVPIQKKRKLLLQEEVIDHEAELQQKLKTIAPNQHLSFHIKDQQTIQVLKARNVNYFFPIQAATFVHIINGEDIIGRDRTGSGKTLSYAIPLIQKYRAAGLIGQTVIRGQQPLLLVILPTRELVIQVVTEFRSLVHRTSEFRVASIYGGTEIRQQILDLREGTEIVVGTPGRIMDLYDRKSLSFTDIKCVILDEADQMLQFNGFEEDIEKIYNFIRVDHKQDIDKIQNILFSATIPEWVHEIARQFLKPNRAHVDLVKNTSVKTSTTVEHLAINCPWHQRIDAISDVILVYGAGAESRTIIFCEKQSEANDIVLKSKIQVEMQALHGDIPQQQRELTFQAFREGKVKCLVATNVASRGLDIPQVDLIVQLEPPKDNETYIHRSGRTGRAGREGVCITFFDQKKAGLIERIERAAQIKFKKVGAPQPLDIITASSRDIAYSMRKVNKDVLPYFADVAKELIEEVGAEAALQRALAYISGFTDKIKQRSLLCSIEGFVTFNMRTMIEFRTNGYIWGALQRVFPPEIVDQIRGMKSFKNMMGASFDVPDEHKALFEKYVEDCNQKPETFANSSGFTLEVATELPELQEDLAYGQTNFRTSGGNNFSGSTSSFSSGGGRNFMPNSNGGGSFSSGGSAAAGGSGGFNRNLKNQKELEVFFGGFSFDFKEQDVNDFLQSKDINYENIRFLTDESGQFKGIAFVYCSTKGDVDRALVLEGSTVGGRRIRVNMAEKKF